MRYLRILVPALFAGLLVACGGGGGTATTTPSTILSGTAAAGAPIIGTVTVKGALGNTKSALIEADGNYDVDVTGLTAPYRLRAEGTVGGRTYKLHSYAVESDIGGNVNITPFTDLIVANVAGQIAESYFDDNSAVAELAPADIDAQETELQAKLQDVFTALGVDTAIDLLNSTFSADHSGLDAALDVVNVEVDAGTNIATITNLIENTTITDNVTTTGETDTLVVNDSTALTAAVSDTQAMAAVFDAIEAAYANGLPTAASIQDYFADDFYSWDAGKSQFLTEITTDPTMVGATFSGISVSNIDTTVTPNTAEVTFSFGTKGIIEVEPVKWFVAKHATLGWQVRGDQRIVETDFSYHCNDYDGDASFPKPNTDGTFAGDCGINTQFWDRDATNNGTNGAFIASGTVEILDQSTPPSVKATIYLGTPANGTAGDVQVYSPTNQNYQWDWMSFSEIPASTYTAGDTIRYSAYTEDLDLTDPTAPAISGAAVAVATYTDTILFAPETVLTKLPTATAATKTAMQNFTLGSSLTVAWTLAADTRNEEVLLEITDSAGNRIEIWDWSMGTTSTSKTFSSSLLSSTAASSAGLLSTDTTYNLKVRIYAENPQTGQSHSRDYNATIPGPAATTGGGGTTPTTLTCGYDSGWNDAADAGLGAPINPNSFADFESVVADCGATVPFTAADIAGTSYSEAPEVSTFNVFTGSEAGTAANPGSGTYDDAGDGSGLVLTFQWYVETVNSVTYLVVYTDETVDPNITTLIGAGFKLRETSAMTGVTGTLGVTGTSYTFKNYSEQSNYSTDGLVRSTGSDGEIWTSTLTQL